MTSLPPIDSTILPTCPNRSAQSAYELVLEAERAAMEDINRLDARVVGFLMINLCDSRPWLGDLPLSQVTKEVLLCNTKNANDRIFVLGGQYREKLLRAFRQSKGPPDPSSYVSRPSFDFLQDMVDNFLEESPTDYRYARKVSMARDGFRCMITGAYDSNSLVKAPELRTRMLEDDDSGETIIQCCHILNEYAAQNIDSGNPSRNKRREYTFSVFEVLRKFGLQTIIDRLSVADGIHSLSNVLTLRSELCDHFDNLRIWLEPTSEENTYMVCEVHKSILRSYRNVKTQVHFEVSADACKYFKKSGKPVDLPLPDCKLLAIHAVCAKVTHMSGADQYFARLEYDVEEFDFHVEDNDSAHLLHQLLDNVVLMRSKIGTEEVCSLEESPS
ncbi:hypothetical protein ABKN59_005828 [Abortiporus biennis]